MKTTSKKSILACLAFLLLSFGATAQDSTYIKTNLSAPSGETTKINVGGNDYWSLGLHALFSKPLNELDENCYRNGVAFDLEILSPSLLNKTSPLQLKVGGHLDYLGSGREKNEAYAVFDGESTGDLDYPIDITTRNNSFGFHGMLRLKLNNSWKIQPYLDGIVGGRALFTTETSTLQNPEPDTEPSNTKNLHRNITFIFGGSVGALVKLSRMTYLDFRVTYSHGSRADFVNLDKITYDPVDRVLDYRGDVTVFDSKTEMLFFSAGVKFDLDFSGFSSISSGNNSNSSGSVFYGGTRTGRTTRNRNSSSCEPRRTTRTKKAWGSGSKTGSKPKPKPKPKPIDY
jgi:hypothetical protein